MQAMQFGATLQRIIQRLVYCNPSHGPPLLAKIDLADGYYCVPLSADAALGLAVIISADIPNSNDFLIALHLALPMGWAHSPPYFYAYTDTITDIANAIDPSPTPHNLLAASESTPQPPTHSYHPDAIVLGHPAQPPLAYTDVYIDDFMVVAQQPLPLPTLNILLHTINSVFQDPVDTPQCQIISQSKLDKGNGAFSVEKRILGWDINTAKMALALPPHCLEQLQSLLQEFLHKKRTSTKKWRYLLGICSTTPALYGAKHLFSVLQLAQTTVHTPHKSRPTRLALAHSNH